MRKPLETASAAVFTALLALVLYSSGPGVPPEREFPVTDVAEALFGKYLLHFELVGVLIVVTMVGAVFIAIKGEKW